MKKGFILSYFLFITCFSFSQVNFESLTFDAALQLSKKTGKIIFLQFESTDCIQCNEVANKAFENKELGEFAGQAFICIKITVDHPDRDKVALSYNKKEGSFGTLFINSDGTLIYSYPGSSTVPKTYREHIDKALTKAGEGIRINSLEKEYKDGNRLPGFMEFFLQARKSLNLETDSLLNEYVNVLPADSFSSIRTLQFIASMAPDIRSQANAKLRQNSILFNKAWYIMSLQERISINRQIGYKSMKKAVETKDVQFANQVASFIKGTYDTNSEGGKKAYDEKMIEFYRETNDTTNYLIRAIYFYDNYFMTAPVDSVKSKDKVYNNLQNEKQVVGDNKVTYIKGGKIINPNAQMFTRELNNAAYSFLKLTNDPLHLSKALQWSARANQFTESYIALNTHALLLYKTGRKEEAIIWQNKAIDLKKKQGFDTKTLSTELAEMNNGTLKF